MRIRPFAFCAAVFFAGGLFAQEGADKVRSSSDKAQEMFDGGFRSGSRSESQVPDSILSFTEVQVIPEFYGGETAMYKYLRENLHYPVSLADRGVGGKVFVEYVIGSTGKVAQVKVHKATEPEMGVEAVRVVSAMPAWKPGMLEGKAVPVKMIMPITFTPR